MYKVKINKIKTFQDVKSYIISEWILKGMTVELRYIQY
jgi:hypothetical protein